jgi:hypothetical protein
VNGKQKRKIPEKGLKLMAVYASNGSAAVVKYSFEM